MAYKPLPENYRKSSLVIATYPYSEIIDGTGVVEFFGCRASIDSVQANDIRFLTTKVIVPSLESTPYTNGVDFDFDVDFRAAKIIEGEAFIVLPIHNAAATSTTPKVTIIHYDGTTETTLVAQTSLPVFTTGAAGYGDRTGRFVIPRTHFKIGEILRINIEMATGANVDLQHTPLGNNTFMPNSGGKMSCFIPFEVEV